MISTSLLVDIEPILKQQGTVINGILSIEIENLDDIYTAEYDYEFKICCNIQSPNVENNATLSKVFKIQNIAEDNTFCVKVPLFLLSYRMEYKLMIQILHVDQNKSIKTSLTSSDYTTMIPSILIQPAFKKDDYIMYADGSSIRSGIILQINNDDTITIKANAVYQLAKDIITIHSSKVSRHPMDVRFLVDLTNKKKAVCDMILKTQKETKMDIYYSLCDILKSSYCTEMEEMDDMHDIENMGCFMAANIYQFLYNIDYNYRIKCVLGNSLLFVQKPWNDAIKRIIEDLQRGEQHVMTAQEFWNKAKYTCDICRVEMSWYEYVIGCKCDHKNDFDDGHAFCVSCIHSIMTQYNELKPFISELLNTVINHNCIEEIVAFCVGKVIKFDADIDMQLELDMNNVIDDTPAVGTKRCMKTNDNECSRKKRRLQ